MLCLPLLVEGEYSPWDMERASGLWLLLEEGTGEESPLASAAAGSDIIARCDTPVEPDSTSSPQSASSRRPSTTPHPAITPSTASFVTTPDSASADRHAPWHRGSFADISPEVPQEKPRLLQTEGAESEEEEAETEGMRRRRRKHRGNYSLPPHLPLLPTPLQGGAGSLLPQLKLLREAPPPEQVEVDGGGARALWRAVFSGNRKERKKWSKTSPAAAERVRKEAANQRRATGVRGRQTEESDLDSSTLLQRCSLTPRNNRRSPKVRVQDSDGLSSCPTEVIGVLVQSKEPSSLSVKETMFQTGPEDEDEDLDLDTKITRRVQRAARRKAKEEQLKRLHKAQRIQRQLQQVEEKQRQLEQRGVMVEKALRGEADYWGESSCDPDLELHLGGLGKLDNPALMQQWFQLVQQKNSLVRYESELMIFARELELEDRQSRLQQELRERMAVDDHLKEEWQLAEERLILEEMLEVVEQRDALVALLEEQRLQEQREDQDLEEVMLSRGQGLSWA